MPRWLRCAINLAVPAGLTACLGVQPGEIAWPGSRIWQSAPAEASLAGARSTADLPGADLAHEIEVAQGRATLPERPVLAEAPPEPQATSSTADDPLMRGSPALGDGPGAGPAVLRVVPGTDARATRERLDESRRSTSISCTSSSAAAIWMSPPKRVLHQLIGNALLIRPSRIR